MTRPRCLNLKNGEVGADGKRPRQQQLVRRCADAEGRIEANARRAEAALVNEGPREDVASTRTTMLMTHVRFALFLFALFVFARPATAQQRPLLTQDPEADGVGQVLIEGGVDASHDAFYPLSGLKGNLISVPIIGISVGLSSVAEFQMSGGPFQQLSITGREPAPLASLVTTSGATTHAVKDIEIGAKIRLAAEGAQRPAFAFRFSTRLPNAKRAAESAVCLS